MITVDFKFTEERFVTCCERYRQAGRRRWVGLFLRLLGGLTCVYFAVRSFREEERFALAFFAFAVVFFTFFGHFINAIARHNHRRSPYHGEDVHMEFSEGGVDIKSPATDAQCRWTAFTKAAEFSDGLLLFRGPLFHWIAAETIAGPGGAGNLRDLVRTKVADYQLIAPLRSDSNTEV